MVVDALVLAGGSSKGVTIAKEGMRGLLEIKGKPMLEYVLQALRSSNSVRKVVLIIPRVTFPDSLKELVDEVALGDGSLTQNIQKGMEYLPRDGLVLTLSADIPLITPEAIDNFLNRCGQKKAQLYYPIIPREKVEEKFPQTKRTYALLKEGAFTGGNLVLLEPKIIEEKAALVEKVYQIRKSPLRLGRALGLKFMLKFLRGSLSLEEVEKRVSALLGAQGRAIITSYPEIGIDVDKDSDLQLVKKALNTD